MRTFAEGPEPFAVPVFCLAEFLRVVTHARVFSPPSPPARALLFLDELLQSPMARLLVPGRSYFAQLGQEVRAADARGNLVYDAQIAALLREHGVREICSFDRDFLRFPGLRLIVPGED